MSSSIHDIVPQSAHGFETTHWSVVLSAKNVDSLISGSAQERLCEVYWPPIYQYIRREGYSIEDSQDITQAFLSSLVHKDWLRHLRHQNGKFRSFLLTFLKHFLSDRRDRSNAKKRGGGQSLVSMDAYGAEERNSMLIAGQFTPEQSFEQRWAHLLLDAAVKQLQDEYTGKTALFDAIKVLQPGQHGAQSYAEIGASLGMSEQAVKNAVHGFRKRYSEILRAKIRETVADAGEVDEEIRYLLQTLAR